MHACLSAALGNPGLAQNAFSAVTKFLQEESHKPVTAPTNAFVLLEWCVLVQQAASQDVESRKSCFLDVSSAAALLLEKCVAPKIRNGLAHSALVVARRGLRTTFRSSDAGGQLLRDLVARLTSTAFAVKEYAPYLGVIAGVRGEEVPARAGGFQGREADVGHQALSVGEEEVTGDADDERLCCGHSGNLSRKSRSTSA